MIRPLLALIVTATLSACVTSLPAPPSGSGGTFRGPSDSGIIALVQQRSGRVPRGL